MQGETLSFFDGDRLDAFGVSTGKRNVKPPCVTISILGTVGIGRSSIGSGKKVAGETGVLLDDDEEDGTRELVLFDS